MWSTASRCTELQSAPIEHNAHQPEVSDSRQLPALVLSKAKMTAFSAVFRQNCTDLQPVTKVRFKINHAVRHAPRMFKTWGNAN